MELIQITNNIESAVVERINTVLKAKRVAKRELASKLGASETLLGKKLIGSCRMDLGTHTWATIAASLDIPKETIAHALGHGNDTVTDIYIDFDKKKVDETNRKVLDFVFGKK